MCCLVSSVPPPRLAALAVLLTVAPFMGRTQTIITFDPPDSTMTIPEAINARGEIAGSYKNRFGIQPGFIRKRDGSFTTFEIDTSLAHSPTVVTDIGVEGQVTGYVAKAPGGFPGFLRQANGSVVLFNGGQTQTSALSALAMEPEPRSCEPFANCVDGTGPMAINAFGQIAGVYGASIEVYSGFLRQRDGTTVDFVAGQQFGTVPLAINLLGQITGYCRRCDQSGFLRERNGNIVSFDPPNGRSIPQSINLFGQITGYFEDANGVSHGFVRHANGRIIAFDPAGSTDTTALSINLEGQIAGYYFTADGKSHGFLRRQNGRIESFDVPEAGDAGTFPRAINDLGQIVGYYVDANSVIHGFLRNPR